MAIKPKYQLRAQLVNNPLTNAQSPELIARPLPGQSMGRKEILARIIDKNPGLEPQTIAMVFDLTMNTMEELLLNGERLHTSLFSAGVAYSGTIEKGVWNPASNKVRILFNQSHHIADEIEKYMHVHITSNRSLPTYISGIATTTRNGANNAVRIGYPATFVGKNIQVAGEHPDVGVTLRNLQTDVVTRVAEEMFALNTPSRIAFVVPAELPEGEYELTVTTQYKGTTQLLKSPRSATLSLMLTGSYSEE
ncbi:MAG: DUF4469 domain-containing protein [Prevotellaceae bacterium]|jgi:hypothetical protein|nr:DUF4469 domain-containing protein [Prevotellaceae bacterium]